MMNELDHWPRLSQSLTGPKSPFFCQSCGVEGCVDPMPTAHVATLTRWREHNQFDKPERIIVVLCKGCSERLIEKHPRLYASIQPFAPMPGSMPLCLDCRHRDGTACKSPLATFNGGDGLPLIGPKPSVVHVRRAKPGRSGMEEWYSGPVRECQGKEVGT